MPENPNDYAGTQMMSRALTDLMVRINALRTAVPDYVLWYRWDHYYEPSNVKICEGLGQYYVLQDGQSEIQLVTVTVESGTFTLTFDGHTTSPIPYNATAVQVTVLANSAFGYGTVTATGEDGGPYTIWFDPDLGDVALMTATNATVEGVVAGDSTRRLNIYELTSGDLVAAWGLGTRGDYPAPVSFDVDADGNVVMGWVLDSSSYPDTRVIKYDPEGNEIWNWFFEHTAPPTNRAVVSNLTLGPSGQVWTAAAYVVNRITGDGSRDWYTTGIANVRGTATDSQNNLYIANAPPSSLDYVYKFIPTDPTHPETIIFGLNDLRKIDIVDDVVYVLETGEDRVSQYTLDGDHIADYETQHDAEATAIAVSPLWMCVQKTGADGVDGVDVYRFTPIEAVEWFAYRETEWESIGLTPEDDALCNAFGGDEAEFVSRHILDMRDAFVELLATQFYRKADMGNPYDFSMTEDSLIYCAMGDRTKYGATGGAGYNWTRNEGEIEGTDCMDIDIGEIFECVELLEAADHQDV